MTLVTVMATIDVAWVTVTSILSPPVALVTVSELLDIFGSLLLVLIGLELLDTMRAYFADHAVRVESVLSIALIAVTRKIIVLDLKSGDTLTTLAIAALVTAMAVAYHLGRRWAPPTTH